MKYVAPSALFLLAVSHAFGQDSIKNHSFHFSAFADVYFHTTFPQQKPFDRPDFLYNHKQQYTPGINLAMAKASYKGKRLQVNVGLMAGDYARYNLASEPALLRHVYEANIGWKFSSAISLEAGILPSHIGLESAISKDALTLSRSFIAENSPYYETGAKLNVAFLPNGQHRYCCSMAGNASAITIEALPMERNYSFSQMKTGLSILLLLLATNKTAANRNNYDGFTTCMPTIRPHQNGGLLTCLI